MLDTPEQTLETKVVKGFAGHNRTVTIARRALYCPTCGKQELWQEIGAGGDYYHECYAICASCGHNLCCIDDVDLTEKYPTDTQAARDARLRQGVEQLRDAMRFNIRTVYLTQDLEAKLTALLAETETP